MRHKLTLLFSLCLLVHATATVTAQNLIPQPEKCEITSSSSVYSIGSTCSLIAPTAAASTVDILEEYLTEVHDIKLLKGIGGDISFRYTSDYGDEGYRLSIGKGGVVIRGGKAGMFYGMRTLQQLIDQYGPNALPYIEIKDSPRFQWRGLMLDCGRYYFSPEYIKKYIDRMSCYKMNVFHWHLSEDSGWRLEIKSHPELVAAGAWRRSTQCGKEGQQDNIPHGGYYTQEQVREIVEYAAERHVTIVPEIDLPGHTRSIIASHPELNCTGKDVGLPLNWRIWDEVLCVGNEATLKLIKDILTEVIELFPGEYIDIGGDEAPQTQWENCDKCKALMKKEHITSARGLQSWLTAQMDAFVRSKGRKIIGWDEILEGGKLSREAAVMSWRGVDGGIRAAREGHKVVMAPYTFMYIDYYQSKDKQNEPLNIGGYLPLEKVYSYEPYDPKLTPDQCRYIMGVQANLWGEYVHSEDLAWYMTYPRALACAEVGWSPRTARDYDSFLSRARGVLKAMDRDQIPFRIPEPKGLDEVRIIEGNAILDLESPVEGATIYYTLDGSDPEFGGQVYLGKLSVPLKLRGIDFKCSVRLPSGRYSVPYTASEK